MKLSAKYIRSLIKPRVKSSHKGDYGHVLVIAGSLGMPGAPVLCAGGALRAGAGLVTVAVPESQYDIVAKKLRPEAMILPLSETSDGRISISAFHKISEFAAKRKVTSIVIGPGLGAGADTKKLVLKLISTMALPVVVDADGLSSLVDAAVFLKSTKAKLILTPHPGEFSRLTSTPINEIQRDRIACAKRFAAENNLVCVLKGSESVVSDGARDFINTTGNPGMASGGSGDVLAGMIGAFTSQVKESKVLNASLAGVYIHGLAGDLAASKKTVIGMIAGDISEAIPEALQKVSRKW